MAGGKSSGAKSGGVLRHVFTVGGLTAFSRVLGFAREMLQSRLVGAGVERKMGQGGKVLVENAPVGIVDMDATLIGPQCAGRTFYYSGTAFLEGGAIQAHGEGDRRSLDFARDDRTRSHGQAVG